MGKGKDQPDKPSIFTAGASWRAALACLVVPAALLACPTPAGASHPTESYGRPTYQVPEHSPPDCGAHFCVHWVESGPDAPTATLVTDLSPQNGIPDLIDTLIAYAERDYQLQVGAEGWQAPKSDGALGDGGNPANDGKVDIYVENLAGAGASPDVLGQTGGTLESGTGTASGFMVVNNSFTQEIDLLRTEETLALVVAHEFNHVLQLGYAGRSDEWMAESTAEWMSFHTLSTLLGQEGAFSVWAADSTMPLAANPAGGAEPANAYGYAIWDWWLAGRYGDAVVRNAWADLSSTSPPGYGIGAYDGAIRAAGGPGFSAEFARFAATSAELNTPSFPRTDSVIYPNVRRHGSLRVGHRVARHLDHTSYTLFECEPEHGFHFRKEKSLTLTATARRGSYSGFALIGRTRSGRVKVALKLAPRGGSRSVTLRAPGRFKRVTAALINADGSISGGSPGAWAYRADGVRFSATLSAGG